MPGELSDIDADAVARESIRPFIIAGGISLRLSLMSIRAARVIISAMIAHHAHKQELQTFAVKHGMNIGFLEIRTEDKGLLSQFEKELRGTGISYSRLPDLQAGDSRTQYLYDLDALDKLSGIIHQNEEIRLQRLDELKTKFSDDQDQYRAEKEKLEAEMPGITLITAEDYAATSVKDGRDTKEFTELESSAERELGKTTDSAAISPDSEITDLFETLSQRSDGQVVDTELSKKSVAGEKTLTPEIPVRRRSR